MERRTEAVINGGDMEAGGGLTACIAKKKKGKCTNVLLLLMDLYGSLLYLNLKKIIPLF